MRAAVRRAALWFTLLGASGCAQGPTLDVRVGGLTPEIVRLQVSLGPRDAALLPQQPVSAPLDHFKVRLGRDLRGPLVLRVEGMGRGDCALSVAERPLTVSDDGTYPVAVALAPPATPDCLLRVSLGGSAAGELQVDGVTVCARADGQGVVACDLPQARADTRVVLTPRPGEGAAFLGFSGACQGTHPCAVPVGRGRTELQAGFVPQVACSSDRWCWERPLPVGDQIIRLRGSGPNDIWALGGSSTRLHWNGTLWLPVPGPDEGFGYGLWVRHPGDAWAGGSDLLHWDGASWTAQNMKGLAINDMSGTAAGEGFAVGAAGQILHLAAGSASWKSEHSGTSGSLRGVLALEGEAWAVGDGGTVLRRRGGQWTEMPLPANAAAAPLCAVAGERPDDVWMVGVRRTTLHWNGDVLSLQSQGRESTDPNCLQGASQGDNNLYDLLVRQDEVWAAGDGGLWRLRDREWTLSDGGVSTLWGSGPEDLWAGGPSGLLLHRSALVPVRYGGPALGQHIAVHGSGDEVWAVGQRGVIVHRRAGPWEPVESGTSVSLLGVWVGSATDAWAVGELGTVMHWDGFRWTRQVVPERIAKLALYGVGGSGPGDVWMGGDRALLRWDGETLSEVPLPADAVQIRSIWAAPGGTTWLAGLDAQAHGAAWLRESGGAFRSAGLPGPIGTPLMGVSGSGTADVWLVALNGSILHWDGNGYTVTGTRSITGGSIKALMAVSAPARGRAWFAGEAGSLFSHGPAGYRVELSGASELLQGVYGRSNGEAYAVGHGTILRRPPPF